MMDDDLLRDEDEKSNDIFISNHEEPNEYENNINLHVKQQQPIKNENHNEITIQGKDQEERIQQIEKLPLYQRVKTSINLTERLAISQELGDRVKMTHNLMIFKDIEFFTQYIDDLYVMGTDIFNMIQISNQYISTQIKENEETKEKLSGMETHITQTSQQSKYQNMHIQEVELDAMFEELQELESQRLLSSEGFDPTILAGLKIPDIEDPINLLFLWCTIALYGQPKEDYDWDDFKSKVLAKKESADDFIDRIKVKKAAKMPRDSSFLAMEIHTKTEEIMAKKYLNQKQKDQLTKFFEIIKVINSCYTISSEIRIKVIYFDQVQQEFLELEVLKAQHKCEVKTFNKKQEKLENTLTKLRESVTHLEKELTDIVELQQNGEQYLFQLSQMQNKYFDHFNRNTIAQNVPKIEATIFGPDHPFFEVAKQRELREQEKEQEEEENFLPMHLHNRNDMQPNGHQPLGDESVSLPTQLTLTKANQKIEPLNLKQPMQEEQGGEEELDHIVLSLGRDPSETPNQFQAFDADKEIDKSGFEDEEDDEDDEDDDDDDEDDEDEEEHKSNPNNNSKLDRSGTAQRRKSKKEDECTIF